MTHMLSQKEFEAAKIRKPCVSPTICNKEKLMADNLDFMNHDRIKNECSKCINQSRCQLVVTFLEQNKPDEALSLLEGNEDMTTTE